MATVNLQQAAKEYWKKMNALAQSKTKEQVFGEYQALLSASAKLNWYGSDEDRDKLEEIVDSLTHLREIASAAGYSAELEQLHSEFGGSVL